MTRESKLAFICGFVLILIIGFLISDHLSETSSALMELDSYKTTSRGGELPALAASESNHSVSRNYELYGKSVGVNPSVPVVGDSGVESDSQVINSIGKSYQWMPNPYDVTESSATRSDTSDKPVIKKTPKLTNNLASHELLYSDQLQEIVDNAVSNVKAEMDEEFSGLRAEVDAERERSALAVHRQQVIDVASRQDRMERQFDTVATKLEGQIQTLTNWLITFLVAVIGGIVAMVYVNQKELRIKALSSETKASKQIEAQPSENEITKHIEEVMAALKNKNNDVKVVESSIDEDS